IALLLVGAYRRLPPRRDLIRPAWLLLGLFFGEAILGGISVELKLAWFSVMGHFLLALGLIGVALLLYRRAGDEARPPRVPVDRRLQYLAVAVYALTLWVLCWGTLVTAAGPHGGDAQARRLGWSLRDVARIHGASVDVLVASTLVLVVLLVR